MIVLKCDYAYPNSSQYPTCKTFLASRLLFFVIDILDKVDKMLGLVCPAREGEREREMVE